jgi:N6-L-threonylcarbamoyladenine synthase
MDKLKLAVQETGITQIAIMGIGKFWNSKHLKRNRKKYGWKTFIPKFEYTTDNAAIDWGYQKFYHNNLKLPLLFLKLEYKYKLCNYFTIEYFETTQHLL